MGFAARALVGPLGLAVLLLGVAPPDAAALAEIAAVAGHPAALHLRATRTVRRDGRTTDETLDQTGAERLERACSEGLCQGVWFAVGRVRTFGPNGVPFPDARSDNARERTLQAILSTRFAESDFGASGGSVTRDRAGDAATERWEVRAPDGASLVAVADAHTHHLIAIEGPGNARLTLAETAAHGTILYAAVPYERLERRSGPIEAPPGAVSQSLGTADLALAAGGLPIAPCTIDGRPARCLIDTGTSPSAVTLAFAERLGRDPQGEIEIAALGDFLTGMIPTRDIRLGPASITRLALAVLPTVPGAFDAILGADALAGLRLTFVPGRHIVRVGPSGSDTPAGTPIALSFAAGVPYVQVALGSQAPTPLLLDTGDAEALSIGYDAYQRDPTLFMPRGTTTAAGIVGSGSVVTGVLARAAIGSIHLNDVAIAAVRAQHIGHVGYALATLCGELTLDLRIGSASCAK